MVLLLLALSYPHESRADPPSCPDAASTQPYTGTLNAPYTHVDLAIEPQHPCETLSAQLSATVPYQASVVV
jgi:hypothetical protein